MTRGAVKLPRPGTAPAWAGGFLNPNLDATPKSWADCCGLGAFWQFFVVPTSRRLPLLVGQVFLLAGHTLSPGPDRVHQQIL